VLIRVIRGKNCSRLNFYEFLQVPRFCHALRTSYKNEVFPAAWYGCTRPHSRQLKINFLRSPFYIGFILHQLHTFGRLIFSRMIDLKTQEK
jgi:hypothetical protein